MGDFFEGRLNGMSAGLPAAYLDDIAKAIERRTAVLWAGTGASMSAGAPSWLQLIQLLTERVPSENVTEADRRWVKERLSERNLIALADYLEVALGKSLHGEVKEIFSELQPQSIHREIQRIPFDLIVTTNFDHLIEDSYIFKPRVFTGDQPFTLLQAIKDAYRTRLANIETRGLPILVKLHGSIGESESLILSSSGYRDIQHKSHRLREVLKHLLMMRQFLFVGTSLTDPHLLGLLDEVIAEFGIERFGPHYAILGSSEANPARIDLLNRLYSIRTLVFHDEVPSYLRTDADDDNAPMSVAKLIGDERLDRFRPLERSQIKSTGVKYVLNSIGGRVSLHLAERRKNSYTIDEEFSQAKAFLEVLREAVLVSGSLRGDICLVTSEGIESPGRLTYRLHAGPTDSEVTYSSQSMMASSTPLGVNVDSICGRAFYICNPSEVVYAPNVDALRGLTFPEEEGGTEGEKLIDEELEYRFGKISYRCAHSDVKSEIAVPILSEGVRIGVLNLESRQLNAYSSHHQQVLYHYAKTLEAIHIVASSLEEKGHGLRRYEYASAELEGMIKQFGLMRDIEYLIYRTDYINGFLKGLMCTDRNLRAGKIFFPLDYAEPSLALDAFRGRGQRFHVDAEEAGRRGDIDERNRKALKATGPIFGMPILSGEVIAGVFVGWFPKDKLVELQKHTENSNLMPISLSYQNLIFRFLRAVSTGNKSRLRQMAFLLQGRRSQSGMSNKHPFEVSKWANTLLHKIRSTLRIEEEGACDFQKLTMIATWDEALLLCENLIASTLETIHQISLYRRARIYLRDSIPNSQLGISETNGHNVSVSLFLSMEIKRTADECAFEVNRVFDHEKSECLQNMKVNEDAYLRFVLERSMHDPLTKVQQADVLGSDDRRTILDKESGRFWLVTPIVGMEQVFDDGRGASSSNEDDATQRENGVTPEQWATTASSGRYSAGSAGSKTREKNLGAAARSRTEQFIGYLVVDDHHSPERDWASAKAHKQNGKLDRLGQELLSDIQTQFVPSVLDYTTCLIAIAFEHLVRKTKSGSIDVRSEVKQFVKALYSKQERPEVNNGSNESGIGTVSKRRKKRQRQ